MDESPESSSYSNAQVMLSLALLSYRGFWDLASNKQQSMAKSISAGLDELAPLKGDWELVWGPSSYRYLGSVFDSSMMYVVRHKKHPARYAIVVRGTNPIDAFDWLFGDLLPHRQVDWEPALRVVAPGAKVSLSTALGLKILLNMRAECVGQQIIEPGKFSGLFDLGLQAVSSAQQASTSVLESTKATVRSSASGRLAYYRVNKLAAKLLSYQKLWGLAEKIIANVGSSVGSILPTRDVVRMLRLRRRLIDLLDGSIGGLSGMEAVDTLLPEAEDMLKKQAPGIGLLELLGNLAANHGDALELFITGHSKGGALAPALALFLADTQAMPDIPAQYQWNPLAKATIHCAAFAAPTPGNSAFATYFNSQLGKTFYQHVNKLDIVTQAWQANTMSTLPDIYGPTVTRLPGVELLVEEIVAEIEGLDYAHLGEDIVRRRFFRKRIEQHVFEFAGPLQDNHESFILQAVYQHVGAYIKAYDLQDVIELTDLIGMPSSG